MLLLALKNEAYDVFVLLVELVLMNRIRLTEKVFNSRLILKVPSKDRVVGILNKYKYKISSNSLLLPNQKYSNII